MESTRFDILSRRLSRRAAGVGAVSVLGLAALRRPAAAQDATPVASPCAATTEAENAAIARRWYDDVNAQDVDGFDSYVAEGVVHDGSVGSRREGRDLLKRYFRDRYEAFPDLRYEILDVLTDGDRAVVRWVWRGTHQGRYLGVEPTGTAVEVTGITAFTFACGQIVDVRSEADIYGLLQQLEALPGAAPATPAA